MFNVGYVIPIIMSCHLLLLELVKYKKEEVSKNIIHFIHALIFIFCHNYESDMVYTTHISIGFYTYDLIYLFVSILKDKSKASQHASYIVHHLITVRILYYSLYSIYSSLILNAFYTLELSNTMLYISYHIHKEYKNHKLIYSTDFIQLIWYSYYRIIKMILFIFKIKNELLDNHISIPIMVFIIYLMGASWSYKLVKINIKNFNSYKTLKN
jgi:hypothetical protein